MVIILPDKNVGLVFFNIIITQRTWRGGIYRIIDLIIVTIWLLNVIKIDDNPI